MQRASIAVRRRMSLQYLAYIAEYVRYEPQVYSSHLAT